MPSTPTSTPVKVEAAKPALKSAVKPAAKQAASSVASKPVAKPPAKAVAKAVSKSAAKTVAPKPAKPAKPAKDKKIKMVRDSISIPKSEYELLDAMKLRAGKLGVPIKKTELIRAGIKALAELANPVFLSAIAAVPNLKTGRPPKVD
jgi:uncharacterized membrane protein